MEEKRKIIYYKHYFEEFFEKQNEIRVEWRSNIFRIFCCFDKRNLVVLFNGFQKKTQKTPMNEIEMALKIMKEYNQKR